jgi:hypothetical protein
VGPAFDSIKEWLGRADSKGSTMIMGEQEMGRGGEGEGREGKGRGDIHLHIPQLDACAWGAGGDQVGGGEEGHDCEGDGGEEAEDILGAG